MSITVGTNSWVTIEEAETYLYNKVGSQDWFLLDDEPATAGAESKESYLITAYNLLLNKADYSLTSDMSDSDVQNAQIEMAYYLFVYAASFEETAEIQVRGVSSFTLSKWKEEYKEGTPPGSFTLPMIVGNFLSSYKSKNIIVSL